MTETNSTGEDSPDDSDGSSSATLTTGAVQYLATCLDDQCEFEHRAPSKKRIRAGCSDHFRATGGHHDDYDIRELLSFIQQPITDFSMGLGDTDE